MSTQSSLEYWQLKRVLPLYSCHMILCSYLLLSTYESHPKKGVENVARWRQQISPMQGPLILKATLGSVERGYRGYYWEITICRALIWYAIDKFCASQNLWVNIDSDFLEYLAERNPNRNCFFIIGFFLVLV